MPTLLPVLDGHGVIDKGDLVCGYCEQRYVVPSLARHCEQLHDYELDKESYEDLPEETEPAG